MPTVDSVVKTVRIPRNEWEEIEREIEKEGITFSAYVRGNTRRKDKGNTPKEEKGTPLSESVEDLEKMLKLLGSTLDEGIEAFRSGLEDGALTYENGEIVVNVPQYDLSGFLRACEEKKVDPQKMIEKMTQNVYRS